MLIGIGPGGGDGVVGGVAKRAQVFSEMQKEVVMLWLPIWITQFSTVDDWLTYTTAVLPSRHRTPFSGTACIVLPDGDQAAVASSAPREVTGAVAGAGVLNISSSATNSGSGGGMMAPYPIYTVELRPSLLIANRIPIISRSGDFDMPGFFTELARAGIIHSEPSY